MPTIYWVLIITLVTIALLDAVGSIVSRRYDINYSRLAIVSFLIYAAAGFAGARTGGKDAGIIVAACAGFFDSTIGFKISIKLKANIGPNSIPDISPPKWVLIVVMMTVLGGAFGFVGSELAFSLR